MCNHEPASVPQLGTLTLRPADVVVFFGDSISTPAYEWYGPLQDDVEAFYAGEMLSPPTWEVEAVGGNTMAQLLSRVGDVTAHDPDVVFIEAGINDAATGVPEATTAAALEDILDALLAHNASMRIAVIGPWISGHSVADTAGNLQIEATNDAMRDVAVAYDVPFVDWRWHYEALYLQYDTDVVTLAPDGVHPSSPLGQELLSDKVMLQVELATS